MNLFADLSNGLVGYWTFDEGIGDTAYDYSGNENHGVVNGDADWTIGVVNSALQLDGADDFVDCGNSPELNPSNALSICVWYKPVEFSSFIGLVQKAYSSHTYPHAQYSIGVSGTLHACNFMVALETGSGGDVNTPNDFFVSGNWYHIVGTYDGDSLRLYVDNELIHANSGTSIMEDFGMNLHFGKYSNLDYYLPGYIDEIRIYNRALHVYEIEKIYLNYECGDANEDDTVDISDAVYIINYAFGGGPAPYPLEAGDVNCDDSVDISDAVYVINYAFAGGNEPCDPNSDFVPDC